MDVWSSSFYWKEVPHKFDLRSMLSKKNKPRTAQVGAICKVKKTRKRKPLFLQLKTTKALKKLKFEKKNPIYFFEIFLKFPVSRIVPKNVKGGTLWDFLNIHSVVKYQKLMGGTIKKSVSQCRKKEESLIVSKKVDLSALE